MMVKAGVNVTIWLAGQSMEWQSGDLLSNFRWGYHVINRPTSPPLTCFTFPLLCPSNATLSIRLSLQNETTPEPQTHKGGFVSVAEMPSTSKWCDEGRGAQWRPGWDGRGVFTPWIFLLILVLVSICCRWRRCRWRNTLASSALQVPGNKLSDSQHMRCPNVPFFPLRSIKWFVQNTN